MPAAYIIADVTVTDAEKMAEYRVWSSRAMQEFGAEVLVRGGESEVLEGPWAPGRLVMLKFPSRERVQASSTSEIYTHARSLREGAGVIDIVCVEGA